jgi:hypothetical protein
MAQIDLGSIKFNWKGSYSGATAYVVDDVVESSGSSYICIAATTGNAPPNATYWEQMSSAGTNGTDGTDLTTTLTTQGDLVYRDGSGLQRLGAGTAGQILQTGGTGANPSWTTMSSDVVKLASGTNIDTAKYSIDGYYTSDYTHYKYIFSTVRTSATGTMYIRVNIGGSEYTGGDYKFAIGQSYRDSGSTSWTGSASGWGDSNFRFSADNHGNTKSGVIVVTVDDPLTTNGQKQITTDFTYMRGSDGATHQRVHGGCTVDTNTAISGITIYGNGNFKADHFALYGFKA